MSNTVAIEKNKKSAPSETDISTALSDVGAKVLSVEGTNASRTATYTGNVNHTDFQNELERVAKGNKISWNFFWADAQTRVLDLASRAEFLDKDNISQSNIIR